MLKTPKVLLVVSCSKKKAEELKKHKMKAIKAYTGPIFQVIHKAVREGRWGSNFHLGIISAKYGFLHSEEEIEYYDLRINKELAEHYNSSVLSRITKWHTEENFDLIFILMGKDYMKTIQGLENHIDTQLIIDNMGGTGLGQKKLVEFIQEYSDKPKSVLDYL